VFVAAVWTLFRIALRNVARNRRRTLITSAALFVGVGVMVSMRGLLNGLQRTLVTNAAEDRRVNVIWRGNTCTSP